jgi:hypothetical protein
MHGKVDMVPSRLKQYLDQGIELIGAGANYSLKNLIMKYNASAKHV